jgi:hypothetical protein
MVSGKSTGVLSMPQGPLRFWLACDVFFIAVVQVGPDHSLTLATDFYFPVLGV